MAQTANPAGVGNGTPSAPHKAGDQRERFEDKPQLGQEVDVVTDPVVSRGYRYWPAKPDSRLAILACFIADQQRAGFKDLLDIREEHCPTCNASGFNTGWGAWSFACGLEILSDGEPAEPCPHEQSDAGAGHGTASTTDASPGPGGAE